MITIRPHIPIGHKGPYLCWPQHKKKLAGTCTRCALSREQAPTVLPTAFFQHTDKRLQHNGCIQGLPRSLQGPISQQRLQDLACTRQDSQYSAQNSPVLPLLGNFYPTPTRTSGCPAPARTSQVSHHTGFCLSPLAA